MPTYTKAPREIVDRLLAVMGTYRQDLERAAVSVDVLMAHANRNKDGEITGPALALHGYPCYATVKINSTKLRVQGLGDATITIDADRWPDLPDEQKDAILDHELEHLELVTGEHGTKLDDLDRPRLRIKLHDQQFGWFDGVARRHGKHSIEVQQADTFIARRKQLWLPLDGAEQDALKRERTKRGKRDTKGEEQITLRVKGKPPKRVTRNEAAGEIVEDVRKKFGLRPNKAAAGSK